MYVIWVCCDGIDFSFGVLDFFLKQIENIRLSILSQTFNNNEHNLRHLSNKQRLFLCRITLMSNLIKIIINIQTISCFTKYFFHCLEIVIFICDICIRFQEICVYEEKLQPRRQFVWFVDLKIHVDNRTQSNQMFNK